VQPLREDKVLFLIQLQEVTLERFAGHTQVCAVILQGSLDLLQFLLNVLEVIPAS
jgi:hypothetical protein